MKPEIVYRRYMRALRANNDLRLTIKTLRKKVALLDRIGLLEAQVDRLDREKAALENCIKREVSLKLVKAA